MTACEEKECSVTNCQRCQRNAAGTLNCAVCDEGYALTSTNACTTNSVVGCLVSSTSTKCDTCQPGYHTGGSDGSCVKGDYEQMWLESIEGTGLFVALNMIVVSLFWW